MRNFDRIKIVIPPALQTNECIQHLESVITNPNIKVSSDFYKGKIVKPDGTTEFSVRVALKNIYKNKCAYCEKLTHAPKIEHHRPKGKVVGTNNQNRGYYWLCYEWTNLLPSCTDCNSIESKGSKYPILGNRNNTHPKQGNPPVTYRPNFIYDVKYNTNEQPLLLHPEYCNPEENFDFNLNGKIYGITTEGIETVSVIKLDNDDLNGWRKKIYDEYFSNLKKIILKYFRINNPISQSMFEELIYDWCEELVIQANDEKLEYTLFRKFLFKKIDYFFINELDIAFRPITKITIANSLHKLSI
jgi:hypothetical protein